MKIGIVTNLYRPYSRGGAEIIARRVAQELIARGHDVFVVTTMPFEGRSSLHLEQTETHVERLYRFYPLNFYHLLYDSGKPFFLKAFWHLIDMWNPQPAICLRRVLKQEQPDVVLTHNMKGFGLQSLKVMRELGVPHIHTLHDVQLSVPSGLILSGKEESWINRSWLRRWYERQVQRILRSPKVIISPSKFLLDFYHSRGFFQKSDVRTIPNPAPDIKLRQRTSRGDGKIRLFFAGQLEKHKGLMQLLQAVSEMDDSIELHIAGEGSLADYIADRSQRDKRIVHHGFVSFEHLVKLLDMCDATVVPSLCYENSPTVIYESLQAGVPVIASNIGGVGELVRDGENGFLIEPGNVEELKQAIIKLKDRLEEFQANATELRHQMKQFSLAKYVDKLEELMS